jgi:hypothetical protein
MDRIGKKYGRKEGRRHRYEKQRKGRMGEMYDNRIDNVSKHKACYLTLF